MIGQTLNNRYKITDRIGKGAMGTVYRAMDTQTGRDVALKVISSELAIDPEMLERFKREGEALSKLKHPNITAYLDAFQHDDNYVIVMEYVPGGSLYDLIKSGPLPIDRTRQIALDLCDALIRAHRLNIIHRDLKPENILMDEDGTPKLADFGVARLTEGTRMTRTGTKVGTPYYMAPEAWKGEKVDAQADIWSLGVILYEMLAGKVPFDGDSEFTIMTKICTTPPPDLRKLRSEVPPGLLRIVSRMLTREKEKRYQTTRQVAVDLESSQQLTSPKTIKPLSSVLPKFNGVSRRIGLLILLGLLGFGGFFALISRPPTVATPTATEPRSAETSSPIGEVSAENPVSTEAIASCEPAGTEPIEFPADGESVTGVFDQEPDFIVSYFSQNFFANSFTQLTLAGLAEWDDQGQLVPELAAKIPSVENGGVSADGLTITWKLKECLFWSDGVPLTSADVKFTWEAIMDPGSTVISRAGYEKIESIETPDDTTVSIHFAELYAPWPILFMQSQHTSGAILPSHIFAGQTALDGKDFIRHPTVGSGPFIVTEWAPGDFMTLLPNPNFHAGRSKLDRIVVRFVPDSDAATSALQGGDADWYSNFSDSEISTYQEYEPAINVTFVPTADFEHYFFNLGRVSGVDGRGRADNEGFCPFKDVRVRKAITLGIDRQEIIETFLGGLSVVPTSQWLNSAWENTDLQPDRYNPNQARALLDEAGYVDSNGDGVREGNCNGRFTELSFDFETTTAPLRIEVASAVQADLAEIGIALTPIHTPAGEFFAPYAENGPLTTGSYQMANYTAGFYPDPYTDNYNCEAVPNAGNPNGNNWYHNCDPFLSDLMESVNETADPAARNEILDEIQAYIFDNYYVIPMYARGEVIGSSPRFVFGPIGGQSGMYWNAEAWDVK